MLIRGLTATVTRIVVHPEEQGVALGRVRVLSQRVLQGRDEFVAVQRHHSVVMVRCTSIYLHQELTSRRPLGSASESLQA